MISWLNRNLLFTILVTQVGGFLVLGILLLDHASAPHHVTQSSVSANNIVTGTAPASVGYQEGHAALLAVGTSSPMSARRADTKPERLSGNTPPVTVGTEVSNPEAFRQSNETVERALSAGLWSQQDSRTLRQHMANISDAERIELLEKIYGAVNRQQLKLEGSL